MSDINNKVNEISYKDSLKKFEILCNQNPTDYNSRKEIIEIYEYIIKKEKEIQYYKNEIKDKFMLYLKENNNNICINGKKVILFEYSRCKKN